MAKRLIIFLVVNFLACYSVQLIVSSPDVHSVTSTEIILLIISLLAYLIITMALLKGLEWKSRRSFLRIMSGIVFVSGIVALLFDSGIVPIPEMVYLPFGYLLLYSNMVAYSLLLVVNSSNILVTLLIIYFSTALLIYFATTILHYNDFRIEKLNK